MKAFLIFGGLIALLATSPVMAQKAIDPSNSTVSFTVSNLGVNVKGKVRKITGEINFDPAAPEKGSFAVTLPVKSVHTGNGMRDKHLMEEEFFHQEKYPDMTFQSESIVAKGSEFVAMGTLTIKGTSNTIDLPFTYTDGLFSGTFTLNRQDYKIGGGGFLDTIGDKVTISINCKLVP